MVVEQKLSERDTVNVIFYTDYTKLYVVNFRYDDFLSECYIDGFCNEVSDINDLKNLHKIYGSIGNFGC